MKTESNISNQTASGAIFIKKSWVHYDSGEPIFITFDTDLISECSYFIFKWCCVLFLLIFYLTHNICIRKW